MGFEIDDWDDLLAGVRQGEPEACRRFWEAVSPLLERVAARHISPAMQRRIGPESIMLSACRTFFEHARQDEYDLPDSAALWRLLCAITVNKVRMKVRYHSTRKRDLGAEAHGDALPEPVANAPSAQEELEFSEHFAHLVGQFDEEEQQVIDFKLQGLDNGQVAERMKCSERTVRRLLNRLEERLGTMLSDC